MFLLEHFKSSIDLDTYTKPAGTLLYAICKAAYSYFLMHACICAFTVKKTLFNGLTIETFKALIGRFLPLTPIQPLWIENI